MNGGGHVLQTSQGEGGCQTEVEGTGAAMQRAMDIPGLNTLAVAEFARGGEATVLILERKSGQGREPVKPCGRICDEGKHALGGRNDTVVPHECS